jgi:hypothetical protein
MQSRRVFLGSAATAGVGSVVGGGLFLQTRVTSAQGHAHPTADPDPLFAELQRQMAASITTLQSGGKGGEPARRIAGILRLATAAGVANAFDARLRAAVRRHGRDAILLQTPDLDKFAAEIRQFGIDRVPALTPAGYGDRARILDTVLANGIGSLFAAGGAKLEQLAVGLDRRMVLPIAALQEEDPCRQPCAEVLAVEVMMMLACLGSVFDGGAACFFLTGLYIGLKVGYYMRGCSC